MFYYIQKNLPKSYIIFNEELSIECYNIGTSLSDYSNGYYIQLNDEQVKFASENPQATGEEIFKMELNNDSIIERTLDDAKQQKLKEIDMYDASNSVNNFIINNTLNHWFTVAERTNYSASINAAKTVGIDTLSFFVEDTKLEITTPMAEIMLAQIQLYADQCFIITKQHKLQVLSLKTIEEVDSYNYKVGYPEQLNFQLD